MTQSIPTLSLATTSLRDSQNRGWRLGQIAQGKVAVTHRVNPTVNIGGTNYQVTSDLQFARGESLLLKVSGVYPQIEFSIISRSPVNVGKSEAAAVILHDKFLHSPMTPSRNLNASVSKLIGLLHASSTSHLPPPTALLLESLRSKLLKAGELTNPKRLEHALASSSLLVELASGSASRDSGLLALLRQIADSLEGQRVSMGRLPSGMKYQQALGMSLYLSNNTNLLRSLSREIDEQYSKLVKLRNNSQEDMQLHAYRLLAELPVLYRNQVESISIRFPKRKSGARKESDLTDCSVEFEFEFGDGKIYTRITLEGSSTYFSIGCKNESTAIHLSASSDRLGERLGSYGLQLEELMVVVQDDYPGTDSEPPGIENRELKIRNPGIAQTMSSETADEATRSRLREMSAEGRMPELEEFALRIDHHEVQATHGIPTHLYCTMACFFAQLFELEEDPAALL